MLAGNILGRMLLSSQEIEGLKAEPVAFQSPFIGGRRLLSLLEYMERFNAVGLLGALSNYYLAYAAFGMKLAQGSDETDEEVALLHEGLEAIDNKCTEAGFHSISRQAKRLLRYVDSSSHRDNLISFAGGFSALTGDLHLAVLEELRNRAVFQVLPEEVHYYDGQYFDRTIINRFPDAQYDLDEAGKCFALNRYTATAFHLLRTVEAGLDELRKHLNVPKTKDPSWAEVIRECEKAGADKELIADLRIIKNAWRNPTMHVERRYDKSEADELMAGTRIFLRHLVSRI